MDWSYALSIILLTVFVYCIYLIIRSIKRMRHYRNRVTYLDRECISCSPFQPTFSIIVYCDLSVSDAAKRIESLFYLNYIKYDVIVICDSSHAKQFSEFSEFFGLEVGSKRTSAQQFSDHHVRMVLGSRDPLFSSITVVDMERTSWHNSLRYALKQTTALYIIPIKSIDVSLTTDSISIMASVIMDSEKEIREISGMYQYEIEGGLFNNIWLVFANLSTSRSSLLHLDSAAVGVSHSTFSSGDHALSKEFIPEPLIVLHRSNSLKTYISQIRKEFSINRSATIIKALICMIFALFVGLSFYSNTEIFILASVSLFLSLIMCNIYTVSMRNIGLIRSSNNLKTIALIIFVFIETLFSIVLTLLFLLQLLFPRKKADQ